MPYLGRMSQDTITPMWTLGDRLRKARELTGMSQEEFAAVVGISRNTVANYEKGHTRPRMLELRAWARASRVDIGWLSADQVLRARRDSNPRPSDYIAEPWATAGSRIIHLAASGRVNRRRGRRRTGDTVVLPVRPVVASAEAA